MRKGEHHFKETVESDLGLSSPRVVPFSQQDVERCFHGSLIANILLLETGMALLLSIPLYYGVLTASKIVLSLVVALFLGLALYGYYLFGKHLLGLCRTREDCLAAPPLVEKPFETALGRTMTQPISIERLPKANAAFRILAVLTSLVALVWFASFLDWTKSPILTAICIGGTIAAWAFGGWYGNKRVEEPRNRFLLVAILWLCTFISLCILTVIECGSVSPGVLWEKILAANTRVGHNPESNALYLCMFVLISVFAGLLAMGQWFRLGRQATVQKETEYDNRLREAVARYEPGGTEDESTPEPLRFPETWSRICLGYGLAILVVFVIGLIIAS